MVNLSCLICADFFTSIDNVHATVCGHMFHYSCLNQWLQRSETCPQCRNKCNIAKTYHLYFNVSNSDRPQFDVGLLQEQLDKFKLQLQDREKEFKKAEEEIKSLLDSQKVYMEIITRREDELKLAEKVLKNHEDMIGIQKEKLQLKDKIDDRNMETRTKLTDDLLREVKSLKQLLEMVESVTSVLAASNAETEKHLQKENDPKKLKILVATLKHELRSCEKKLADKKNFVRVLQSNLRHQIEFNKNLKKQISEIEGERSQSTEKLEA